MACIRTRACAVEIRVAKACQDEGIFLTTGACYTQATEMVDKGTAWRVHGSGGSDVWTTTLTRLNDTRGDIECACLIVTNRLLK